MRHQERPIHEQERWVMQMQIQQTGRQINPPKQKENNEEKKSEGQAA